MPPSPAAPKTLLARVEALETELAVLKAERSLDVLSQALALWTARYCATGGVGATPPLAPPVPEWFRKDVILALHDDPANLNLVTALDVWPKLQDVYHEAQVARRRTLHQHLAVAAALIGRRQHLLPEKKVAAAAKRKVAKVATKQPTDHLLKSGEATDDGTLSTCKCCDVPPLDVENVCPLEQQQPATTTHELAKAIDLRVTAEEDTGEALTSSRSAPKRTSRRKSLTPAKTKRRAKPFADAAVLEAAGGESLEDPMMMTTLRAVPAKQPAQSDDDKGYRDSVGERPLGSQHVESDSGVATRPRRPRKFRSKTGVKAP